MKSLRSVLIALAALLAFLCIGTFVYSSYNKSNSSEPDSPKNENQTTYAYSENKNKPEEPSTKSVEQKSTEQTIGQATTEHATTEPAEEQTTEQAATEPATEQTTEQATEQATEPAAEQATEQETTEPAAENIQEPTQEQIAEATPNTPAIDESNPIQSRIAAYYDIIYEIIDIVNQERVNNGLNPLIYNETLTQIATYRSMEGANNNYFSHTRPNGEDYSSLYYEYNTDFCAFGENLARYQTSAAHAMSAWMASPGHRRNILYDYDYIGVGVAQDSEGRYYYTQEFARDWLK